MFESSQISNKKTVFTQTTKLYTSSNVNPFTCKIADRRLLITSNISQSRTTYVLLIDSVKTPVFRGGRKISLYYLCLNPTFLIFLIVMFNMLCYVILIIKTLE